MLRYSADYRTLATVAVYFALAIWSWFAIPSLPLWAVVLVVAANSWLSFTCAVITHNTIHVPIFRRRAWNRFFQVVLTFTYGHPVSAYVPGHNLSHHQHTQSPLDSIRTTKARFRWNLLNQLLFFFLMSGDILKGEIRFAKKMRREKPAWFRQYLLEMVLVMGTKLVLLLADWKLFLLVVFIPHQVAAWGIVGTNYFQHDGCDETHPYNHSRTFTSPVLNFFLFNNGYHGAHHDRPGLHWSKLPAYHAEHVAPHLHPNLNRHSLLAYLWETHIWPGKRLDYLGRPVELPPAVPDEDWVAALNQYKVKSNLGGA